ncbi:MAG: hypothetical protein HRU26_11335 [Psychroserpens sp.]|nr:hypothetical protein [Psychroserpens sp.]
MIPKLYYTVIEVKEEFNYPPSKLSNAIDLLGIKNQPKIQRSDVTDIKLIINFSDLFQIPLSHFTGMRKARIVAMADAMICPEGLAHLSLNCGYNQAQTLIRIFEKHNGLFENYKLPYGPDSKAIPLDAMILMRDICDMKKDSKVSWDFLEDMNLPDIYRMVNTYKFRIAYGKVSKKRR